MQVVARWPEGFERKVLATLGELPRPHALFELGHRAPERQGEPEPLAALGRQSFFSLSSVPRIASTSGPTTRPEPVARERISSLGISAPFSSRRHTSKI